MILALFRCDSMDDLDNVLRILLPSTYAQCSFSDKLFKPERSGSS
jgi:hypothetical protein